MQAIDQLVEWLQGFDRRIELDELKARLDDDSLQVDALIEHISFSDDNYSRNLVAYGPQFYALVMCWQPGQVSPIHDHKDASCGVRVIQGVASETRYRKQADKLVEDTVVTMTAGEVCGSFDDDIHQIRNNSSENLVTLHVYSPYLNNINLYNLESGEVTVFCDPLVESLSS